MTKIRQEKVQRVSKHFVQPLELFGKTKGELLVISWGSTYGVVRHAVESLLQRNDSCCSWTHLRYLNPLPEELADLLKQFNRILVIENNLGQLAWVLRAKYLVPVMSFNKIQGKPFLIAEIHERIMSELNNIDLKITQ